MMTLLKPRAGMRLTADEFMELPDTWDRRKMELDNGLLYLMPKPGKVHGFFQSMLIFYFVQYLDRFDEPPAELLVDFIVALPLNPSTIRLAPDLTIVLPGNPAVSGDRMLEGTPDIVIEILSSDRRRDLVRKRMLYAAAGVPEYWIFDPVNDDALLLELRDGEYVQRARLDAAGTVTTPRLPGLAIPLADVFRHRRRPA